MKGYGKKWRDRHSYEEELEQLEKGTVIIRSHGISKAEYDRIKNCGFEMLNATCPFVSKIHRYVESRAQQGYDTLLSGNPEHPEVQGIKGWAGKMPCNRHKFRLRMPKISLEKIKKKICIVSQTTFNYNKFKDLVEILCKKEVMMISVLNTICNATEERQREAKA